MAHILIQLPTICLSSLVFSVPFRYKFHTSNLFIVGTTCLKSSVFYQDNFTVSSSARLTEAWGGGSLGPMLLIHPASHQANVIYQTRGRESKGAICLRRNSLGG